MTSQKLNERETANRNRYDLVGRQDLSHGPNAVFACTTGSKESSKERNEERERERDNESRAQRRLCLHHRFFPNPKSQTLNPKHLVYPQTLNPKHLVLPKPSTLNAVFACTTGSSPILNSTP